MFHWICPECGREIPPAVTECPACDPKAEQASAAEPAVPIAAAAAPVAPVEIAPKPVAETPTVLSAAPDPVVSPDPLFAMAEQIRAAQIAALALAPAPEPERESPSPGLAGLALAVGLLDAPTLDLIPIPAAPPEIVEPAGLLAGGAPAPAPTETQTAATETVPAAVALAQPEPITQPVALAEPVPVETAPAATPLAQPDPEPVQQPEPEPVALAEPLPVETAPAAVALAEPAPVQQPEPEPVALAEPVPAENALPTPVAPQSAPGSPDDLLIQQTPPPVPQTPSDRPPSGSWLRLAPLQDYSAAASRAMHPAVPAARILTPDSGPRMTLPGPALPPQLNKRENLRVVTVLGNAKAKRGLPGWLVSLAVMFGLLAGGAAAVLYLLPASHSTADAKTTAPAETTAVVTEASHPLAQSLEVTGIRFVIDLNKKSEIHYLVVNHSPNEMSDMTVFVKVRAANSKPGSPPLCQFSFRSTGLGPFESKEMTSPIEKVLKPVALPDWHDLRAEVQIAQ